MLILYYQIGLLNDYTNTGGDLLGAWELSHKTVLIPNRKSCGGGAMTVETSNIFHSTTVKGPSCSSCLFQTFTNILKVDSQSHNLANSSHQTPTSSVTFQNGPLQFL